jgi:hypothetical protein
MLSSLALSTYIKWVEFILIQLGQVCLTFAFVCILSAIACWCASYTVFICSPNMWVTCATLRAGQSS